MIKNVQKNDVNVEFSEKELSALVKLPSGDDYSLKLRLLHPIIPEQSTFKVLSTKIEIKMKKPEAVRWEKLEGQGDVPNPKPFIADVKTYIHHHLIIQEIGINWSVRSKKKKRMKSWREMQL